MAVKLPILQKERLVLSIHVINLRFSESDMLTEVVNKALQHNFDVVN